MIFNFYKKSIFRTKRKNFIIKDNSDKKLIFRLEIIYNIKDLRNKNQFVFYTKHINSLLTKEWGVFPTDFVQDSIKNSKKIILIWEADRLKAFTIMSLKKICGRLVHYIEFSVVEKGRQGLSVLKELNFGLIKEILFNNFIFNRSFSIELMFISPNIKTLSTLAKFSSYIYPNPFLYNQKLKSLPLADDLTWKMANELIGQSKNPDRKIEREGCVVNDSYKNTPWLIYGLNNFLKIPQHQNKLFNEFTEKYLEHQNKKGKEFIVRIAINFVDVIKFILYKKFI